MVLSFPARSEAARSINEEMRAKLSHLAPSMEVEDHPTSIGTHEFEHHQHIHHDPVCQQTQDHTPSPSYSSSSSQAPIPGPPAFQTPPTIKTPLSEITSPEHHNHNHCGNNNCGNNHCTSSGPFSDRAGDAGNFPAHIACHVDSDEGLSNPVENNMPPNESMSGLITYLSHYLQDLTFYSASLNHRFYQVDLTLQDILAVLLANRDPSAAPASAKKKKDNSKSVRDPSAASEACSKKKNDIPDKERKDLHASFAKKLYKLQERLERERERLRERGCERQEEEFRLLLRPTNGGRTSDGSYTIGGEGRRTRKRRLLNNNKLAAATNGTRRQHVLVNRVAGGNMTGGCPLSSVMRETFMGFAMMFVVFCLGVMVPGLRTGQA